ncbi:MAG: sugar nucleotide-binding protein [Ignavibacteriaceae bacterium]|nr:sugar nucleotide-binding protein [Ignavibacteriaceae bacterium]
MKKIYIAGCGGMLGEAFYKQFSSGYQLKCTDIDVNEKWLEYLDFRNFENYKKDVIGFMPDYLFHLGAYTDMEFCENHPDETYLTNTLSVENAVFIANQINIPVLYIGTAGIFNGKKDVYDDWDLPDPKSVYARAKYAGELFVKDNANKYLICRAGWMMGSGPVKDKKFINKLIKKIKNGEKELFIVNDKGGTPTYTQDFAKNVKLLIEKEFWGLYNMASSGQTTRAEIAVELLKLLNLENKVKITLVSSDYYKDEYYSPRPASECLINKKLELRQLNVMRDWKTALKEYITIYFKNYIQ